jgi:hypothetical protein
MALLSFGKQNPQETTQLGMYVVFSTVPRSINDCITIILQATCTGRSSKNTLEFLEKNYPKEGDTFAAPDQVWLLALFIFVSQSTNVVVCSLMPSNSLSDRFLRLLSQAAKILKLQLLNMANL